MKRLFCSSPARRSLHSYGVAGSRVVPRTTIGADPAAFTSCGLPVVLTGQSAHTAPAHAICRPHVGAFFENASASFSYSATPPVGAGRSRHVTALSTCIMLLWYVPSSLRSA